MPFSFAPALPATNRRPLANRLQPLRCEMPGTIESCTCNRCVGACKRNPGWFGLDDAERALNAGLAPKMMLDYWIDSPFVYILAPASVGYEGKLAPDRPLFDFNWTKGHCTFLKANRCLIHYSGYKPMQCKGLLCCTPLIENNHISNLTMRNIWDCERGRLLVERWRSLTNCQDKAD